MAWVGSAVEAPAAGETITLYLDLKPGEKADFEVVGRAAAAFAETVKEIAYLLEPGLEIRLEFDSSRTGTLRLNANVTDPKKKAKRAALIAIVVTVGTWFIKDLRTYGVGKLLDRYLAPEQRQQLSEEDIQRIARAIKDISDGKMAKEQAQQVYKELERDTAVTAVGTIASPDAQPLDPVPRSEFPVRAGIAPPVETSPRKRTKTTIERLTLVSPVLIESDRVWKLASPHGEFGYAMKDEKFVSDVLAGRRKLVMKKGIQLTAKVQTHEVLEGGVWVIKGRDIVEVKRVHRTTRSDLFSQVKKAKKRKRKN